VAEELKRQKQIEEIEGDSFTQQEFRTVGYKPEKKDDSGDGFEFGTVAEVSKKTETKTKLEQLNSEGLINPTLFGNQEEREQRYLANLFQLRQQAIKTRGAPSRPQPAA